MLFSIDHLWYLCVLVICSCWQYGCTPQLASDKQYRLQAQLAHVVSRIDILFYFFKYTTFILSVFRTTSPFIYFNHHPDCAWIIIIIFLRIFRMYNLLGFFIDPFTIDVLHTKFIKLLLPNQIVMQQIVMHKYIILHSNADCKNISFLHSSNLMKYYIIT